MSTPIPTGQGATPEQVDQIAKHANNGGPAFPIADPFSVKCPSTDEEALRLRNGMTLRDYFAAKAMQAFIGQHVDAGGDDHLAEESYSVADAMLRARGQA